MIATFSERFCAILTPSPRRTNGRTVRRRARAIDIFDSFAVTPDGVWIAASQTVYVGTLS